MPGEWGTARKQLPDVATKEAYFTTHKLTSSYRFKQPHCVAGTKSCFETKTTQKNLFEEEIIFFSTALLHKLAAFYGTQRYINKLVPQISSQTEYIHMIWAICLTRRTCPHSLRALHAWRTQTKLDQQMKHRDQALVTRWISQVRADLFSAHTVSLFYNNVITMIYSNFILQQCDHNAHASGDMSQVSEEAWRQSVTAY